VVDGNLMLALGGAFVNTVAGISIGFNAIIQTIKYTIDEILTVAEFTLNDQGRNASMPSVRHNEIFEKKERELCSPLYEGQDAHSGSGYFDQALLDGHHDSFGAGISVQLA
jgi:hypothetical protein